MSDFFSRVFRFRQAFAVIGAFLLPVAVQAQSFGDRVLGGAQNAGQPSGLTQVGELEIVVGDIIASLLSLVGVILILIMIYAGFLWMTAGGNLEQVKKARSWILNAIIGLVIVFAAYAITSFVIRELTQVSSSGSAGGAGPQ